MSDPLTIACPRCQSPLGDWCVTPTGRPISPCPERTRAAVFADLKRERQAAAAKPSAPTPKPDDFTEATPPPRTRPIGEPVPAYYVLPPGEDVRALFAEWDRAGRLPAGAVLCDWRPGLRGPADATRVAVTVVARQYGSPKWVVLVPVAETRKAVV